MNTITDPQGYSAYGNLSVNSVVAQDIPADANKRITQQQLLPNAITNRFLSQAISKSGVTSVPFTATNSTSTTVTCNLVDKNNRVILALPQISVYIGINTINDVATTNQWPTTAVGGGNFPVYFNPFDYQRVSGNSQVARVTCRNNSGSDQQVLLVVQWKILTVPTTTFNNATTS